MQNDIWQYFQFRVDSSLKAERLGPVPSVLSRQLEKVGGYTGIQSDAGMAQLLDALLEEAFADHSPGFVKHPAVVATHHKWRYSSAYQKAVRRNDLSIKAVAAALNQCDPMYIWRRAPTIALEEVSLGDPWVCAVVLHACRFARVRKQYGCDELAGFLGELMGSAVKDRLSCDSYCLSYFHPGLVDVRAAVEEMPPTERAELYRSDDTPFAWRMAAGIALAGPRYGGDVFVGLGGSQDQLAEAVEGLVPYPIQWISKQYSKMARDGMFVSLPLVWRQLTAEGQVEVVRNQLPERVLINGVLSATFDGHTREGRDALTHFAGACDPIRQLLKDDENRSKVLALAVFTADSSLLDRCVTSPWATALYEENLLGEVLAAGSSIEKFTEITKAVSENRDALDAARRWVLR